ncbi:MAG: nucleoside diphosphate kinase regulator [Phycisphaerae bacterium]|nr:nucleoside diphosphate kinase regulator [Phycisphaerae bacterium]
MQNTQRIYLSEYDADQLRTLISTLDKRNLADRTYAMSLENEVNRAEILPSSDIPDEIVRMNSRVQLTDLDTGNVLELQVVYPSDADFDDGKISVLSPIGTALLGYRVEDVIMWDVPGGTRRLKIDKMLHQPEAVGGFFQ